MSGTIYLNGIYADESGARIRFDDRGFIFADGIYEVVRCYAGKPFRLAAHMERMRAGATEIGMPVAGWRDGPDAVVAELGERNGLAGADFSVYMQVTRGAGVRTHTFPDDVEPTVIAWVLPVGEVTDAPPPQRAITVVDRRWSMCNVKTTGLLLNVLAKQAAAENGAQEAIFVRDGLVTEGGATNFFGVLDGKVVTHPEGPHILPGITRAVAIETLEEASIPVELAPLPGARLADLDEAFITGTGCEIAPIVGIDGRPVGDGGVGPVTQSVIDGYRAATRGQAAQAPA